MTRSTGTFPSYIKLNIDPKSPPDGWNEGIRRCQSCKQAWPNLGLFSPSPCCNAFAGIVNGEGILPSMTWEAAAKALLTFRFEKLYKKWNEDLTDEELVWFTENLSMDTSSDPEINELERMVNLDRP